MNFEEACVKNLMETILVIKQSIEVLDQEKKAQAGALLGSQAFILTQFLQQNNKNPYVQKCAKMMEEEGKKQAKVLTQKFSEQFNKTIQELRSKERKRKEEEGDLRYVG